MLLPPRYSYAWASGHSVALASLRNVETDIGARNRRTATDALRPVGIRSQPVDIFPVRTIVGAGYERGDGLITHEWEMVLGQVGFEYVIDTYLNSGAVTYAAMTINTRRHEFGSYTRYNCYLTLPSRRRGDVEYLRQNVLRVTWRFTDLVSL